MAAGDFNMAGECINRKLKPFKKCETCTEDYSQEHWSNLDCEDLKMVKVIPLIVKCNCKQKRR